ncbi:MAG: GFA family protein [Rhizobiales bacterium]|nr:GFA family protein [Hyphomicrobiales bacterium]
MSEVTAKGSCLCGGVCYQVTGPVQDVTACHCTQCRKQSGHFWASSWAAEEDFELLSKEGLTWYRASDIAVRGFCATCGSALFWKKNDADRISFSAGSLDEHPGVTLTKHIFTEDKGDYYALEPKE